MPPKHLRTTPPSVPPSASVSPEALVEEIELSYENNSTVSPPSSPLSVQPPASKRRRIEAVEEPESSYAPRNPPPSTSRPAAPKRPPPDPDLDSPSRDLDPSDMGPEPDHTRCRPSAAAQPSYKRQRLQSPQPELGEKRSRFYLDVVTSDAGASRQKRWKADPETLPPTPGLLTNRSPLPKSKSRLIFAPSKSDSSLPNFVPGPAAQTEYAEQVSLADELREAGNAAYQAKDYQNAVELYSAATEAYPLQPLPGRPAHPGYTASLANRASAHMALNDHSAAVIDLRQSMKSTILPPFLPDPLRTTLARRILRLVKCHLALLEPKHAFNALEHVFKPGEPVFLSHTHPLWKEMSVVFLRTTKLTKASECVERERSQKHWKDALAAIEAVEQLSNSWAYSPLSLPGIWRCWKAEAQVWLGDSSAAHETLNRHIYSGSPDVTLESENARVQGLIYMAQANFESAIRSFGQALTAHQDTSVRQMCDRAQLLKASLSRIERLAASGPNSNYALVLTLASGLLLDAKGPVERLVRIQLCAIMLEARVKLIQPKPFIEQECTKVLTEMGFSFESRGQLKSEFRPFVIRALLCRARVTHSRADFKLLSTLLRLEGWGAGTSIDLAEVHREIEKHGASESARPLPCRPNFYKSGWDPKGYYAILQVSHLAQTAELKRSYRALCRTCHPDKGGQTSVFQQLQEAFDVLSDPVKRRAYDRGHR